MHAYGSGRTKGAGASMARVECPNGGELDFRPAVTKAHKDWIRGGGAGLRVKRGNDIYNCRTTDASGKDVVHLFNSFLQHVYVLTTEYNKAVETGEPILANETTPAGTACTAGVLKLGDSKLHLKTVMDTYFKVPHDGPVLISGLPLPAPNAGPYHFVRCDFHPGLREVLKNDYSTSTFTDCDMP